MSALKLKLIACGAMLLDHIGFALNFMPFRIIGRIAFPIFLYLIYNGYKHTSSPLRYALRLGLFALLSQVPFSLFCYNRPWSSNGNVFFTLLMALLCIWAADALIKRPVLKWFCWLPAAAVFCLYHFGELHSDYGAKAILAAMVFYLFHNRKWVMSIGFLAAVFYRPISSLVFGLLGAEPDPIPTLTQWEWIQAFSAFALPLLFAYNGEKGRSSKPVQWGFYCFYPAHLLLLWLIRQ